MVQDNLHWHRHIMFSLRNDWLGITLYLVFAISSCHLLLQQWIVRWVSGAHGANAQLPVMAAIRWGIGQLSQSHPMEELNADPLMTHRVATHRAVQAVCHLFWKSLLPSCTLQERGLGASTAKAKLRHIMQRRTWKTSMPVCSSNCSIIEVLGCRMARKLSSMACKLASWEFEKAEKLLQGCQTTSSLVMEVFASPALLNEQRPSPCRIVVTPFSSEFFFKHSGACFLRDCCGNCESPLNPFSLIQKGQQPFFVWRGWEDVSVVTLKGHCSIGTIHAQNKIEAFLLVCLRQWKGWLAT